MAALNLNQLFQRRTLSLPGLTLAYSEKQVSRLRAPAYLVDDGETTMAKNLGPSGPHRY